MTKMSVLILPRRPRPTLYSGFLSLPTYRSIKIVKAAKITAIEKCGITRINTLSLDALGQKFELKAEDSWFYKHEPQVGGYVVVYDDGYCSYSPSVPFEKGHVRIDTPAAAPDRSNHAMLRREVQALANLLLGRTSSRALPPPEHVGQALLNAIAMYGEPEQKAAPDKAAAKTTFDILGINKNAAYAYQFDPSADCAVIDALAKKAEAEMRSFAQLTVMPLVPHPAETELALENEFYNWAVSHKLTHEGKPNLATIMQAFDEMVMQCDEQILMDNLLAGRNMTHGEVSVLMERARQVTNEGHTAEKDDSYTGSELVKAAGCYLIYSDAYPNKGQPPELWPWAKAAWKPTNYRHDLVRAGALILAELDRLDRKRTKVAG